MIPALAIYFVNGVWITLLLGIVSARFRDIPPIVQSVVRISFFLTPIIWHVDYTNRPAFLAFNPFYHFVELIRTPLSGGAPSVETWYIVLGITLAGCTISLVTFSLSRRHIPSWT